MEAGVKEARSEKESRPYMVAVMAGDERDVEVRIIVQAISLADALISSTFALAKKKVFVHFPSTSWFRQNDNSNLKVKMEKLEGSHFTACFMIPGEYRYMDDYKVYGFYKGKSVSGMWSY